MSKYRPGITEKRLNNRRFMKTENAILDVIIKNEHFAAVEDVAKKAGVSRSTFYNHHKAIRNIILDYKSYIIRKYRKYIRTCLKQKNSRVKNLYYRVLLFILHNKKVFEILLISHDTEIYNLMIDELRPKIETTTHLPVNSNKIFYVYKNEIISLIIKWCDDGFKENEIDTTVNDILYLTKTMRERLFPLTD